MAIVNDPLTFDFGFTAVDENELEAVRLAQQSAERLSSQLETVDNRVKM